MIALTCTTPGIFEYNNKPVPDLKEGYAILKIKRIGICGTDYHAFAGTQPFFSYPRILGHELAAEIVEIAKDNYFYVGETVTISPYFFCGTCIACRNKKTNCCVKMSVFGVHQDGGMQQYVTVPISAIIHGRGLTEDELCLVEPLAIGAHGVSLAAIKKGEFVLIIGAGPIGLGTAKFAQIAGADVIVVDYSQQRLDFCKEKLGIEHTINPGNMDMKNELLRITSEDLPTVVIDCTGNQQAINGAITFLAHGGRLILIGLQKNEIIVSHPEFHKREATLKSSRNALPEDFTHVIECINNKSIVPTDFISHRIAFEEVSTSFKALQQTQGSVIKAIVEFE